MLLALVSRSKAANAPSKLMQDICKERATSHGSYDDCVTALELDPTADSADINKLAKITATASFKSALSELGEDPFQPTTTAWLPVMMSKHVTMNWRGTRLIFLELQPETTIYGKLYSAIASVVTNHLPQIS
ncbi:hypothetical protein Peur_027404 [Populus x canadensis]